MSFALCFILNLLFVSFYYYLVFMTYGYIRVSTDKQTVENQRFEINQFCKKNSIKIDDWIQETVSGTLVPGKRQLGTLLENVEENDLIICSELSRLGRSLFMIMSILNILMEKKARVWTIKDNYRLGNDIQSKVLAFAFGLSAEIERNLISQRTKEALERRKAEGVKLGRPKGRAKNHCLDGTDKHIAIMLQSGISSNAIAKSFGCSRTTIKRKVELMEA